MTFSPLSTGAGVFESVGVALGVSGGVADAVADSVADGADGEGALGLALEPSSGAVGVQAVAARTTPRARRPESTRRDTMRPS
ncbi:hypothetical protein QT381_10485 [Galbitalea sp. SE-J8]|uniref:hypothetical protein n=1 Tax=Galbitalea sp. SE-J8 TaxID=3054952 RepID=UPI00259C8568|nr:hypothetical protein [Galbitalea sp. SE-J8]MDM4763436.1 hypothetical protein [Galbitalea sp. SE-J8]